MYDVSGTTTLSSLFAGWNTLSAPKNEAQPAHRPIISCNITHKTIDSIVVSPSLVSTYKPTTAKMSEEANVAAVSPMHANANEDMEDVNIGERADEPSVQVRPRDAEGRESH